MTKNKKLFLSMLVIGGGVLFSNSINSSAMENTHDSNIEIVTSTEDAERGIGAYNEDEVRAWVATGSKISGNTIYISTNHALYKDSNKNYFMGYNKYSFTYTSTSNYVGYNFRTTGTAVKALQSSLNKIMGTNLQVDGIFGPATHTALINFQKANGLSVDGTCGKETWPKINQKLPSYIS